jgi:hypothetical protein
MQDVAHPSADNLPNTQFDLEFASYKEIDDFQSRGEPEPQIWHVKMRVQRGILSSCMFSSSMQDEKYFDLLDHPQLTEVRLIPTFWCPIITNS